MKGEGRCRYMWLGNEERREKRVKVSGGDRNGR